MARPRKVAARVDGARTVLDNAYKPNTEEQQIAATAKARPDPAPGNNGEALARLVEFFKAEHPAAWDAIALCPLQHGLDVMIGRLR